jgi:hypothetical protein
MIWRDQKLFCFYDVLQGITQAVPIRTIRGMKKVLTNRFYRYILRKQPIY